MGFIIRKMVKNMWKKNKKSDASRKAGQAPPPGVVAERDLAYLDDGHKMHLLDIFYPEGTDGLLPVIFDVHGGGWVYGDKELNEYFCMNLAMLGFAVTDMSYRLMPETDLKGQIGDVFACLRWVYENGGKHHCDISRFYLTGDSAGGHLASLAAAINADDALCELYGVRRVPVKIRAIALNHSLGSLHDRIVPYNGVTNEFNRMWFGNKPTQNPIYGKSGLMEVARKEAYPPVLVVTSPADGLYPLSKKLIEYLEAGGFDYKVAMPDSDKVDAKRLEQLGHVFNVLYPEWPESREINAAIATYFRGH